MQRDCEEAERAHGREIERLREDFERSMREKEERHRCKIREFQDRDNAWQQEKQVRESLLSIFPFDFSSQYSAVQVYSARLREPLLVM